MGTSRRRFSREFKLEAVRMVADLWTDPMALHPMNEGRSDLVEKYTEFREEQWVTHQALAQRFSRSGEFTMTPDQLRALKALGYLQ